MATRRWKCSTWNRPAIFVRVIKPEIGVPQAPEGGAVTAARGREKGKLSDAVVVDVLIKKYPSHLSLYPFIGRSPI